MKEDEEKLKDEMALFRYSVLGELVHLAPGSKGIYQRIAEKAALEYKIPGSLRTTVAPETVRDWLKRYRQGGFEALKPKRRKDAGKSRSLPQEVADLLVSIKEEHPKLSVEGVIKQALASGKVAEAVQLPPTTVHRLLSRHGLMRKEATTPTTKDHRRFAFEKAGELWMSDVMHGPAVFVEGQRKRKTYLIAFLDDATRVVPYATFCLAENTQAFLPVFEQALMRRGIPLRLFVDNGAPYRSHRLALVCAKLGVALIHARAYHPQAKGKLERWFRTVRMQLISLLNPSDTRSLEALNRRLWAYIEGEYHHAPHCGLQGETPLERWAKVADEVRYPEAGLNLKDLFLWEVKRKVKKDRTVSLHGWLYEVDASLVDCTVTLRYDPSRPGRPVHVWHQGRDIQEARVVDTYANCFVKRQRPEPPQAAGLELSKLTDNPTKEEQR